jgi:serine/threonine protein kinase
MAAREKGASDAAAARPHASALTSTDGGGRLLNGRYRLVELLGRGGMGIVYRAEDTHERREVALKMMRSSTFDAASVALFKAEFRTLSTLRHPHIARVHDFAACRETLEHFFTMELVAGANAVDATKHASFDQILDLIVQVARALSYLHTRNVVHLDLKPANILVARDFTAKVVDFSIARSLDVSRQRVYGTPQYMAPELLLDGGEIDLRADLYALGVTLFKLLFRRAPAAGTGQAAFVPLDEQPRWIDHDIARAPVWLLTVLRRLMARTPSQRYRNAGEVIAAIDAGRGTHVELETRETSGSYVASARLVGLDSILGDVFATLQERLRPVHGRRTTGAIDPLDQRLLLPASASQGEETLVNTREHSRHSTVTIGGDTALDGTPHERPTLDLADLRRSKAEAVLAVLCTGPEGSGKSRVLAEVRLECQLSRCLFVEAACVADTLDPFAVWESIARQLRTLSGFSTDADESPLQRRSGEGAGVAGAKPVGEVEVWAAELAHLLEAQPGPCLVAIDDVHWLAPASFEVFELLLESLARGHCMPSVTFLCTARDQLAEDDHDRIERLRRSGLLRRLRLPRLTSEQVGELVTSMLGTVALPPGLVDALATGTEGNALQVAELLRAWVADGTIQANVAGWRFLNSASAADVERRIHRLFNDELRGLSPEQLELLQVLALFGEPAPLELIEELSNWECGNIGVGVTALTSRRIAFVTRGGLLCFSASRWQTSVLATLTAERAAELHRRIARSLERHHPGDLVGLHYERGADLRSAAEWYARGAEHWLARGDFRRVARCFRRVMACGASGSTLGWACSAAAEANRLIGDRATAAALAQRALELLPVGSPEWMRASRVAIATFNPAQPSS